MDFVAAVFASCWFALRIASPHEHAIGIRIRWSDPPRGKTRQAFTSSTGLGPTRGFTPSAWTFQFNPTPL